ncbi:MAG: hypothetical protein Q9165_001020 [Trypethelium subeluteriae]
MSNNQRPKDLDVAARSIDLTTAIVQGTKLDLVSIVEDASTSIWGHIVRWLAREKVSEQSFIRTMRLGLDVAQPNETGLEVLQRLKQTSSRLFGLQLILPGALGRTVLYDEQLKWIGTTEAVLLKNHSSDYAVDTLCRLFLVHSMDEEDPKASAMESMIRPVIKKLVDSIHFHLTNMGVEIDPSPECLNHLTKHHIDHFNLADIISELMKVDGHNLLFEMNCYIVEIVDWVLTHWSGRLVICVDNEIVSDEILGISGATLTVAINDACTSKGECVPGTHVQDFGLGKVVGKGGGTVDFVYRGALDVGETAAEFDLDSGYRSSLYDIRNPFKSPQLFLNAKEQKAAERAGQEVVRCILGLSVTSMWHTEDHVNDQLNFRSSILGLRVDPKSATKYRWWLNRVPTIVQMNLGSKSASRQLYSPKHAVNDESDLGYRRDEYSVAELAYWYPEIHAAMETTYERCECGCNDQNFQKLLDSPSGLNDGCLVNMVFVEVLLQIAHAISDGAGARDISNLRGRESALSLVEGTKVMLGCIAAYGRIYWNTWFRLCSSAVTGLPFDMASKHGLNGLAGGFMFVVAGSMTVAPIWYALEEPIKLQGSWGIKQLDGSIPGLDVDAALLEAHSTNAAAKEIAPSPISVISGGEDADEIQLESVIFSNTEELYRIGTIVKTKSALRLISPLEIYKTVMEAARPQCAHESVEEVTICPWSLNDMMLGWAGHRPPKAGAPHIGLVANSFVKQNVAIGLAGQCVLQGGDCCFACLAQKAETLNVMGICGSITRKLKRPPMT